MKGEVVEGRMQKDEKEERRKGKIDDGIYMLLLTTNPLPCYSSFDALIP